MERSCQPSRRIFSSSLVQVGQTLRLPGIFIRQALRCTAAGVLISSPSDPLPNLREVFTIPSFGYHFLRFSLSSGDQGRPRIHPTTQPELGRSRKLPRGMTWWSEPAAGVNHRSHW